MMEPTVRAVLVVLVVIAVRRLAQAGSEAREDSLAIPMAGRAVCQERREWAARGGIGAKGGDAGWNKGGGNRMHHLRRPLRLLRQWTYPFPDGRVRPQCGRRRGWQRRRRRSRQHRWFDAALIGIDREMWRISAACKLLLVAGGSG